MSELDFGRQIVNRTARYNGLGRRDPDDEHRIVERYRAPVEQRLEERRRQRSDEAKPDEGESFAMVDPVLDEYLRHREF